ncbi:MAG: ABC transporter ATP-binding protein [Peptococcaceae bacterium]|nr:ABC transporter ATP-binding protein [Peptococcaceae bacterium]
MSLLEIENLTRNFGGVTAVANMSFQVNTGEIVAFIGPNGAGKTTLFNLITGLIKPDYGTIKFKNIDITGKVPEKIAALGINRTFQNLQLFNGMTVVENVMVGAHRHGKQGLLQAGFSFPGVAKEERFILAKAMEKLELVGLTDKKDIPVEILPYGQQRLLEIARAMAMEPKMLLLDEPAAGLNQGETDILGDLICKLPKMGMTILLVEHNMDLIMRISHHIVVLDHGSKLFEGNPGEVQNDAKVIAAYLGEEIV